MPNKSKKSLHPLVQDTISGFSTLVFVGFFILAGYWLSKVQIGYGIALFIASPVVFGVSCATIDRFLFKKKLGFSLPIGFLGAMAIILAITFEGIICLIMAAPILVVASWGAYVIADAIYKIRSGPIHSTWAVAVIGFCIWSVVHRPDPVIETHVSTLVVNSTPDKIYPYLFNLDEVDKQGVSILGFGFAHPTKVVSVANKVGARRECQLTTGIMGEEITELIPNRRLAFKVLNTPPSMKETNPFGEVKAGHLKGNFECIEGKFELTPLPNGTTLITGTSKYRYRFYPEAYWGLFTREIVREVQTSVMNTIKRKVESAR